MRRRREEEGIQLRKQKREQQLFKRRNVTTDDIIQVKYIKIFINDYYRVALIIIRINIRNIIINYVSTFRMIWLRVQICQKG